MQALMRTVFTKRWLRRTLEASAMEASKSRKKLKN